MTAQPAHAQNKRAIQTSEVETVVGGGVALGGARKQGMVLLEDFGAARNVRAKCARICEVARQLACVCALCRLV